VSDLVVLGKDVVERRQREMPYEMKASATQPSSLRQDTVVTHTQQTVTGVIQLTERAAAVWQASA
jgi:hypothetical protein